MVEEQKLEERAEAVKRLRSLFDMHKVAFGAPVNLRGMLLNLHHDRHFSMDFWAVVNAFSEGTGGGTLSEEEMFEAVVESVTGVTSAAMPSYERPAVVELSQMIGGIDLMRPAEEVLEPVEPLPSTDETLSQQGMGAKQSVSADLSASSVLREDAEEGLERHRSISEALARLEQTTRELRQQLAQMESSGIVSALPVSSPVDSQVGAESVAAEPLATEAASPVVQEQRRVVEERPQPVAPPAAAPPVAYETQREDEDEELTGSPLGEAHPPHRFIDVVTSEPRASAASASSRPWQAVEVRRPEPKRDFPELESAEAGPLSSPLEQIRPPAGHAAPVSVAVPATQPVPIAQPVPVAEPPASAKAAPAKAEPEVFEPKPPHKLSQRGLAVPPPPLDDEEINANPPSFGRYGEVPEPASRGRGAIAAVLLLLLGAGAYAGLRTEQGQALLASARQWAQNTYNSVTGHSDDTSSAPTAEPAPVSQPQPTAESASPAPTEAATPPPAASPTPAPEAPAPAPKTSTQPSAGESETVRTPRRQPFVDDSVLRVPAATMAANLISSRAPVYPPAAIAQQVSGVVTLDVVVGSNGAVKFAKAIDGDRLLQAAAEEAVLRWHYKPYIFNGEPVSVSTTVPVRFKLPEE